MKEEKLWNRNFFLLWQGSFISSLGDTVYNIALGFWILSVTGSPGIMGTVMALSVLPVVLCSPLAGAVIDRFSRKSILVVMDLLRGTLIILAGLALMFRIQALGIVFAVTIGSGICTAFFTPAVRSILPDLVPGKKLMAANSFFNMSYVISQICGMGGGGILFGLFGAPLLFLANGISFFLSGISELFIKKTGRPQTGGTALLNEIRAGYRFVWQFTGLKKILLVSTAVNFFSFMGISLLIPLFNGIPDLGPGSYGIAMGVFAAGNLGGMIFSALYRMRAENRYLFFISATAGMTLFAFFIPLIINFPFILVMAFCSGFLNILVRIIFYTVSHMVIPDYIRGRFFSLQEALSSALMPLAMASGGILAEFIPVRPLMAAVFLLSSLIAITLVKSGESRNFINFDPGTQTWENLAGTAN